MKNEGTTPAMGAMPGRFFALPGIDGAGDIFGGLAQGGWNSGNPFPVGGAGGGTGGADAVATFAEDALGDFSDDGDAPTDIGTLALGTTVVAATQQGDPRDMDYITFTVPEGMQLSGLMGVAYEAEPGNLAFLGIERGAVAVTDPGAPDASTLLGGLTYGHYVVSVDILGLVGSLEGAEGFDGPLGPGEYTLWLNQTGPASTVALGLELTEAGGGEAGDDGGDPSADAMPAGSPMPDDPALVGGVALAGPLDDFVLV